MLLVPTQADVLFVMEQDRLFTQLSAEFKVRYEGGQYNNQQCG
jgi:hypothetical protein